jgi:hypothetical protein
MKMVKTAAVAFWMIGATYGMNDDGGRWNDPRVAYFVYNGLHYPVWSKDQDEDSDTPTVTELSTSKEEVTISLIGRRG